MVKIIEERVDTIGSRLTNERLIKKKLRGFLVIIFIFKVYCLVL